MYTFDSVASFNIQPHQVGQRLDRYLTSILQGSSRTGMQQLIADGAVCVNGKSSKPGYALKSGDTVQVSTLKLPSELLTPLHTPLDIRYEDTDLLVVNKAAGMVVHPAPGHSDDTLVNALLAYCPELQGVSVQQRLGIVHRLDKDTSGLII